MKTEMKISLFGILLPLTVFGAWLPPSVVRSDTYKVDVRPYEKERRAIPIDGSNPYDATLHIVPERDCGWVLADSKIIAQNLLSWRSDMTLWKPGGKTPGLHVYHLCNAVSSLEYVFITGTLTKRGDGGGGHTDLPWFDVMVPSVDIDWTGFGYETQGSATFEKYTADKFEDGEDTRIVPISTSVDHSLCSRFVINPPVDDTSLVTPMLELTWDFPWLMKVYDANWNQVISGTQFDASSWHSPRTFYVIAQPDTSPRKVTFTLEGEADNPYKNNAPARPIDKIYGLIPKITVDLDVDSDYDGDIDNDDDALEENPGGLVRVRDALNPGLTEIQLSLPLGASGIVRMNVVGPGKDKIRIWEDVTMENLLSLSKTIDLGTQGVPKTFYVEELAASSLPGDVQIEVTYAKADGTYTSADKIALTVIKAELKSVTFSSDHGILKDNNADWTDVGTTYTEPEWVAGGVTNPISHTKNTKITAKVKIKVEPSGITFDLKGDGPNNYIDFNKAGVTSTGADQEITVIADEKLPNQVDILTKSVDWSIDINGALCDAGTSGDHKIYVTYGTPAGSVVTEKRIIQVCTSATGQSGLGECADAVFSDLDTAFNLDGNVWGPMDNEPPEPIWVLHETDEVGDPVHVSQCPGLAEYVKQHFEMLGLGSGVIKYCRAYGNASYEALEFPPASGIWRSIELTVGHPFPDIHAFDYPKEFLDHIDGTGRANKYEATCSFNAEYYALGCGKFATPKAVVIGSFDSVCWRWRKNVFPPYKWDVCYDVPFVQ